MRIFKYDLYAQDSQQLWLPKNAQILTVQAQYDQPKLWAMVDEMAPLEPWTITTYGTGQPIQPKPTEKYLGTYQQYGGSLVLHVFGERA